MTSPETEFDNNEGCGGFENGGYDPLAIHPTDTNWTRQSRFRFDKKPQVMWQRIFSGGFIDGTWVGSNFVIDRNGNLIVTECSDIFLLEEKGRVLSISPDGSDQVIFEADYHFKAPVIGRGGLIYIATTGITKQDYKLFCLWPGGKLKWQYDFKESLFSRPVLDREGNTYIITDPEMDSGLYCIDSEGILKWSLKREAGFWFEPVINSNGQIYLGTNYDKTMLALDKCGNILWEGKIGGGIGNHPPVIDQEGTIFLTVDELCALNSDGTFIWSYCPDEKARVTYSPAIYENGCLFTTLTSGDLVCVDKAGKERWKVGIRGMPYGGPPIMDSLGNCIQHSMSYTDNGNISYLESFNSLGDKLWEYTFRGEICATVIASDNLMYCITNWVTSDKKRGAELISANWMLYAIRGE